MSDTIVLGTGRFSRLVHRDDWEYVERTNVKGIVAIVAVTEAGQLLLVEQYRPPIRRRVLELPAGLAGDGPGSGDEPLEEAARRELLEEAGYEARTMERIVEAVPSPGICSEVITFFRAKGLRKVAPGGGDATESIEVYAVPVEEIERWLGDKIRSGVVPDIKVYAALHWISQERPR